MASEKRIEANRRNALRSTGPTSEEGKAKVAGNAMRHGLCCRQVVIEGEDAGDFAAIGRRFLGDLQPQGIMEQMLVDRIASEYWRLGRVVKLERQWMESSLDDERQLAIDTLGPPGERMELRLGDAVKQDFEGPAYERLRRYESRIERSLYKAMRELRQMQEDRDDDGEDAPGDGDDSCFAALDAALMPTPAGSLPFGAVDAAEVLPPSNSAESQGHAQASGQVQAAGQSPAPHGSQTTRTVAPAQRATINARRRDRRRARASSPPAAACESGNPQDPPPDPEEIAMFTELLCAVEGRQPGDNSPLYPWEIETDDETTEQTQSGSDTCLQNETAEQTQSARGPYGQETTEQTQWDPGCNGRDATGEQTQSPPGAMPPPASHRAACHGVAMGEAGCPSNERGNGKDSPTALEHRGTRSAAWGPASLGVSSDGVTDTDSPSAARPRKRRRDPLGLARYDAECQQKAARRRFLQRQGTP